MRFLSEATRRYGRHALIVFVVAIMASGCAVKIRVKPLSVSPSDIGLLCIRQNPRVQMADFMPAMRSLFKDYGVETKVYDGDLPKECRFHAEYTANWRWDMAMYLQYAEIRMYDGGNLIGTAEHDARMGGGSFNKFGATREKLAELFRRLFGRNP